MRMKTSAYASIALAMPVLLADLEVRDPGLYDHEKRWAIPFVISALVLFVLGAMLAYFTPRALDFLVTIAGDDFVSAFQASKYFQLVTYMMLAFGVGFEFPIVLIFLQLAGIVDAGCCAGPGASPSSASAYCGRHHPVGRPDQHVDAVGPDGGVLRGGHHHRQPADPPPAAEATA